MSTPVRDLIIVGSGPAGYTAAVYAARAWAPLWTRADARTALTTRLLDGGADGLSRDALHADALERLGERLAAFDTLGAPAQAALDPRPALVAELDLLLTDGLLRYGEALAGRRADPVSLYGNSWVPAARDLAPLAALREAFQRVLPDRLQHPVAERPFGLRLGHHQRLVHQCGE